MTTWWHHPTILTLRLNRRFATRVSCILLLCIALITTLFFGIITGSISHAAPGVNQTIGFQGRLLDSNGDIVPDGYYNVQFKIYQGGTGDVAGNPSGTLKWTETYVNNNVATGAVQVTNGFLSVNLGSITPFGTSVDWNQDTLWLSMNVAGASTSCTTFGSAPCTADGEMLPMKRLTATPYAINSSQLGGISADGFIKNSTSAQTADLNITGTAQANILQGNTSVISPMFDTDNTGVLTIGSTNATTINLGTKDANQTLNIGTGSGNKDVTLGSKYNASSTLIQGGNSGIAIDTSGSFSIKTGNNIDIFKAYANGDLGMTLGSSSNLNINNHNGTSIFGVSDNGQIHTAFGSTLQVEGSAYFDKGVTIQGLGGSTFYTTPLGYNMNTAINIPNYSVGNYGSIFAFGLPSTSEATARGMLVADARTGTHQATIGVLSPDENNIMGFSWNGSNSTAALTSTGNALTLQGNGLNLLTATNNGGAANVGIGNSGASGYALDVTGDINSSTQYRINGVAALTSSSLAFSAASTASVTSASGQLLNIDGKAGVNIQANGTTVATFGNTNIRIGDGADNGEPTLLTVDRSGTTPTATGDSILGSMYYDTTLGKLQCYEATGWGNCSATPDSFISINPEYANAVTDGSTLGTLTSGFCSDDLDINNGTSSQPSVCGANETNNFYRWTSSETSTQTKSFYVNYQLPANFQEFIANSTTLLGKSDSTDSSVSFRIYKKTATELVACGTGDWVSQGVQTTWQTGAATGNAQPTLCEFEAGDSIVFKINLESSNDANAYVSTLNFAYKSR
ncbi:MAG: hypothetical protein WAQ27_01420 [Candidatus Microsaccharimonas sp.]